MAPIRMIGECGMFVNGKTKMFIIIQTNKPKSKPPMILFFEKKLIFEKIK